MSYNETTYVDGKRRFERENRSLFVIWIFHWDTLFCIQLL